MRYLLKIVSVVFVCAIVCSAQTPEPTPLAPGAVEFYQKRVIEDEKQGIESDEPRLRSNQFVQIMENEFVITVSLLSYDNKKQAFPRFEVLLGITEKQFGGSEEVFVQTMKSQPPHLPKMVIDTLSQPLKFNLLRSDFASGISDYERRYFRSTEYRIYLKNEQVNQLLGANSIDFTCGVHQFSVLPDDAKSLKSFIEYERRITKLSRIRQKSKNK